ncbi:MAG TPA: Ig-like domain-containing protein [Dongiaceae bacterium]|nr:Ig-like domain-containing protein [Dongiaceae bacterium]
MFSIGPKSRLVGAFLVLCTFALAASCNGFFVDPTLTGVSVGPQATLNINQSIQMSATGTYSDGTQKTLSGGVTWSSSDSGAVSITTGGLATGLTIGSATITGSAGSCSGCTGTTTVTVALQGVNSITVTPGNQTVQGGGAAVFFHASANGSTDITNPADGTTWTVWDSTETTDQTSNFTLTFVPGTGTGTGEGFLPNGATNGTYKIHATYNSIVGKATLNVQ